MKRHVVWRAVAVIVIVELGAMAHFIQAWWLA